MTPTLQGSGFTAVVAEVVELFRVNYSEVGSPTKKATADQRRIAVTVPISDRELTFSVVAPYKSMRLSIGSYSRRVPQNGRFYSGWTAKRIYSSALCLLQRVEDVENGTEEKMHKEKKSRLQQTTKKELAQKLRVEKICGTVELMQKLEREQPFRLLSKLSKEGEEVNSIHLLPDLINHGQLKLSIMMDLSCDENRARRLGKELFRLLLDIVPAKTLPVLQLGCKR